MGNRIFYRRPAQLTIGQIDQAAEELRTELDKRMWDMLEPMPEPDPAKAEKARERFLLLFEPWWVKILHRKGVIAI